MPQRYDQLLKYVREKEPKAILEIGTWNGMRALSFLNLAPKAKYYGFDLFEDATPEIDKLEVNQKQHYSLARVAERLTGFDAMLIKGNTRDTLPMFHEPVDFVWIDGGHSLETIRSDWENVKRVATPDAMIFFDDYWTAAPVDTSKLGCNEVVKDLRHELLPIKDHLVGGGDIQVVRVWL